MLCIWVLVFVSSDSLYFKLIMGYTAKIVPGYDSISLKKSVSSSLSSFMLFLSKKFPQFLQNLLPSPWSVAQYVILLSLCFILQHLFLISREKKAFLSKCYILTTSLSCALFCAFYPSNLGGFSNSKSAKRFSKNTFPMYWEQGCVWSGLLFFPPSSCLITYLTLNWYLIPFSSFKHVHINR